MGKYNISGGLILVLALLALGIYLSSSDGSRDACVSDWQCSSWTKCFNNTQDRVCQDLNNCEIENPPAQEIRSCQVCVPSSEICDNIDNDCDGFIDEGLEDSASCYSKGLCAGAKRTCENGVWSSCSISPAEESCNFLDDDCDGLTDEGLTRSCTLNTNSGIQSCISGTWGACKTTEVNTFSCSNFQCLPDVNGIYDSSQSCLDDCICIPDWECGPWGEWSNLYSVCGVRERVCTDNNDCPGAVNPLETSEHLNCPSSICGNNLIEEGEVCDRTQLEGLTCEDNGYEGGVLRCNEDCSGYDTSSCEGKKESSVLTYYGCSENNTCQEDKLGQYLSNDCANKCNLIEDKPNHDNYQILYWLVGILALFFILGIGKVGK